MLRKIISGILCMAIVFSVTACGTSEEQTSSSQSSDSQASSAADDSQSADNENSETDDGQSADNENSETDDSQSADNESSETDDSQSDEVLNFTEPVEGEEIAVFDIEGYGQIKIKLFPEQCPKGVENFESLISDGYYDGITFHRVIKDFMIQGGDPTGTGSGGESKWGKGFKQEINDSLRHFSGAVSYATAADKLNGSQFFIVTGLTNIDENHFESLSSAYGKTYSEDIKKLYEEKGGYPFLDGDYEVFGQVFEGLDICFKIAEVQTDSSDKPTEDVVINYAKIEQYQPE